MRLAAQVRATIDTLRRELEHRHGGTHLDVSVTLDAGTRRVVLQGDVLVHRLIAAVRRRVEGMLDPSWSADASGVRVWPGGAWRRLDARVELFARRRGPEATRPPCTLLVPDDGPVQELLICAGEQLVRGRDGTAGWTEASVLGAAVDPVALQPALSRPPQALVDVAREYLGVEYALGGTDVGAIDCSGLVQRAVRRSHGVVVPRHSTDQLAIGARTGRPPAGAGHLVFVWTRDEAQCHVAIASGEGMIHASRSRSRVVEDPAAELCDAASRIEHVPFGALVEFAARTAGHASLVAAGVRLGA